MFHLDKSMYLLHYTKYIVRKLIISSNSMIQILIMNKTLYMVKKQINHGIFKNGCWHCLNSSCDVIFFVDL